VRIGYVIKKAGVADGIIYVDILNGFELEELHDVLVTTVANRDFLSYDSSTTVWRNRQLFDSTAPAALGVSATAGVSITAARVDHVHARPTLDQLDIASAAQGDILYRSATSWARLPAATAGYILQTNGASANPSWAQNTGGSGAPTDAEYIVASANGSLSAERVLGNSTSVTVNFATGGQVSLERAALTGDVTASQNSNATTIANDAVSNAKLANMVASTITATSSIAAARAGSGSRLRSRATCSRRRGKARIRFGSRRRAAVAALLRTQSISSPALTERYPRSASSRTLRRSRSTWRRAGSSRWSGQRSQAT
jgi:hypothetical protein